MIPLLAYPFALLALATVPALAAIYILRNRFRRRQVSSLVLWRFQVQSKAGGAKIHRLRLPLLFFLELLALVLLVAAAAGPQWKLPQSARPLIVVLDDSFSMRAVNGGVSARDRAAEFFKRLYLRQPPPSMRMILAGSSPRSLGSTIRGWHEAADLLPQWQCWSPDATLDAAITLASELGKQQANILVLTDHKPPAEKISNPRLEWHAFGAPLDNLAVVNASRSAFGDEDRCLIEVANFSGSAHDTTVAIAAGGSDASGATNAAVPIAGAPTRITMGPRESQRLVFNIPSSTPALRVSLGPDALAEDNQVQLLPPVRKRVRVEVALTNESSAALVNRTLDATGLRAALSGDPDLVIHETDIVAGSNSWCLAIGGAGATNAYIGPFIVDNSHPLAKGIGLEGVVWAGLDKTNTPGELPVILAGNVPLLSFREDVSGRRHLDLNFRPELSTFQNTPDWPVLFWNILSWRISEMPGLKESNARLGSDVILKTSGEAVTIVQPDGVKAVFPSTGGELALQTPIPGIYTVLTGEPASSSASRPPAGFMAAPAQFCVNVLAADKSDLSGCGSGQWGRWSEDTERRLEQTPAVWIFVLFALGLLATHLYLIAASKGGGQ